MAAPQSRSSSASPPEAWAYCRFSTAAQAHGDSGRRQKDNAKAWCDKHHYRVNYLEDHGVSAFRGRHRMVGQFSEFVREVSQKRLGAKPLLLIENFDRMSRESIEMAHSLFLQLINAGAVIVTLHNGRRYEKGMDLIGSIIALVEMDLAHQYSERISQRVKAAIDERRRAGKIVHTASSTPAWLTINSDRTRFEPIAERVALVREMFHRSGNGQSAEAISRAFNARREPTWNRSKHWNSATIRNILHNRAVLGEYQKKEKYFGDPIVTTDQWTAANDAAGATAHARGNSAKKELNLFTGFVSSGIDKSAMILRTSGTKDKKGKYQWHNYLVSKDTIAGIAQKAHRVKYAVVEEKVLWLLLQHESRVIEWAREDAQDDTGDQLAAVVDRIAALEKRVSKLSRFVVNDDDPSQSLVDELKTHERELAKARVEFEHAKLARAEKAPRTLPSPGNDLHLPEVRRVLRSQIVRWFPKIEVFRDSVVCWLCDNIGLGVKFADGAFFEMDRHGLYEHRAKKPKEPLEHLPKRSGNKAA